MESKTKNPTIFGTTFMSILRNGMYEWRWNQEKKQPELTVTLPFFTDEDEEKHFYRLVHDEETDEWVGLDLLFYKKRLTKEEAIQQGLEDDMTTAWNRFRLQIVTTSLPQHPPRFCHTCGARWIEKDDQHVDIEDWFPENPEGNTCMFCLQEWDVDMFEAYTLKHFKVAGIEELPYPYDFQYQYLSGLAESSAKVRNKLKG